jgi:hypothetical protein
VLKMAQDEGRGFPDQYPETGLGSAWSAAPCAQASGSPIELGLCGGCPRRGLHDLFSPAILEYSYDE